MKKAILWVIFIIGFVFFASNIIGQTSPNPKASKDLGTQSISFGSQNQAKELLKLINEVPGKKEYEIFYKIEGETVTFQCDLTKETITREHKQGGHGKREIWAYFVMERLKSAASGGSLNDTPKGKLSAFYAIF